MAPSNSKTGKKDSGKSMSQLRSTSSSTSLSTTSSESSDPTEFLGHRGYEIVRTIAQGGFSLVYQARALRGNDADVESSSQHATDTHYQLAIKMFDLQDSGHAVWIDKCLKKEMFISRQLKHSNIVQTFDVIKTRSHGYIIMELAPNGSMFTDLTERLKRPYTNNEANKYFRGLMNGLEYIHTQNVAHRDLKLENFLLSADWRPMIADFGFATNALNTSNVVLSTMLRQTRCGTEGYMAPELFRSSKTTTGSTTEAASKTHANYYDAKALDIYAMGICLFEMLNLAKPYSNKMSEATLNKIINQEIKYFNPKVETSCKELIGIMIRYTPQARPNAHQVLKHRWVAHTLFFNKVLDKIIKHPT